MKGKRKMSYFIGVKANIEGHATVQVFTNDGCVVGEYNEGSKKIPPNTIIYNDMTGFNNNFIMY